MVVHKSWNKEGAPHLHSSKHYLPHESSGKKRTSLPLNDAGPRDLPVGEAQPKKNWVTRAFSASAARGIGE